MGIRFVTPETVTLPLSDGDSITIKKRLTHGERDAMFSRQRTNDAQMRSIELAAYLVRWTSTVPYSLQMPEDERIDTINGLDTDSYDEMRDALKKHLDAQQQEKKLPNGEPASSQTSPSVASITGPTTTSADSLQTSTTSSLMN